MKWRAELDEIFSEVTATGKYSQGDLPIDPILLNDTQHTDSTQPDEQTSISQSQPLSRSSTPLKRDISQLLSDQSKSQANQPNKKTKDDAMLLLVKQIGNRLSNPSAEADLKVKAVEILQSENGDMSDDEFNVALDIVENHAAVFVTLSESRRSIWLSRKVDAALSGS